MTTPAAEDQIALPAGTLLNRQYQVSRVLGSPGAFGITYLSYDHSLGLWVAIKEFLPLDLAGRAADRTTVTPHSGERDLVFHDGLSRFLNEAQALARIDHPNVVRVRNFFREHGTAYLVMDYYDGVSLREHLERVGGRLPWRVATELVLRVLDGLSAVHRAGMIHRDIKPSNVYLTKDGRPVLLDFGAARITIDKPDAPLTSILTAGYAPVEQYGKHNQGPWTDVYAAAALLYHLIVGERPPDATDRIGEDQLVPVQSRAKDCPPAVAIAVASGLAVDRKNRPQDAGAFQQMLEGAISGKISKKKQPRPQPSTTEVPVGQESFAAPAAKRDIRPIIFIIAGILALAAAAWLLGRGRVADVSDATTLVRLVGV